MKASSTLLHPGDVLQCARPTDPCQYVKDEIVGTVVWVQARGWLEGKDCDGLRDDWRIVYQDALHQSRVKIARVREDGELTDETEPFVAIVAYKTICWAPKETSRERADRFAALARWRDRVAVVQQGNPGALPRRPDDLPKWTAAPFSTPATLRRWYFATIPAGTYIRAAKGPSHDAAERRRKRDNDRLIQQRERWRDLCEWWPPLVQPIFKTPPRRPTRWPLRLAHDVQMPLVAA